MTHCGKNIFGFRWLLLRIYYIMGWDAVSLGDKCPTFRMHYGPSKHRVLLSLRDTAPHPWRLESSALKWFLASWIGATILTEFAGFSSGCYDYENPSNSTGTRNLFTSWVTVMCSHVLWSWRWDQVLKLMWHYVMGCVLIISFPRKFLNKSTNGLSVDCGRISKRLTSNFRLDV